MAENEVVSEREADEALHTPWARSVEQVLRALDICREDGLASADVRARTKRFGLNRLSRAKTKSAWRILADQLESLVVMLLAAAAGLSFAFGDVLEGGAIATVIVLNTAIGFFTELRAVRSMEALRRLDRVKAKVRRDGGVREIDAREIVPGDIVIVEGGDLVTADLRLAAASKLQADESALTGESLPVGKREEVLDPERPLAERVNMLFKGTSVTRGSGEGVAVATGMNTELGRITSLVEKAEPEATPLEKRLDELGRRLIWATLGIAILVAFTGIAGGKATLLMIETSVALAVAAIPEGLPIVATIALARGMLRMARRKALVRRLAAVETLGATNVICTDKTGTLTENRMAVVRVLLESEEIRLDDVRPISGEGRLGEALRIGALCNNASVEREEPGSGNASVGDPLEIALLEAALGTGIRRRALVEKMPEVREVAFDPETKMMATFHAIEGGYYVAVKGAPESVLEASRRVSLAEGEGVLDESARQRWIARIEELAGRGLRLLALARKRVSESAGDPYEDLTLVAVVGLEDPPRHDVADALGTCRDAGIKVVMVTGDQASTARSIAEAVGLSEGGSGLVLEGKDLKSALELSDHDRKRIAATTVFARVTPKQKLDLVEIFQQSHLVVAMTGDGVNDAPALKKADIGVAMGRRGTEVAKEAADMVVEDDSFATIVAAVEQGRILFGNIRKFVIYLLSCNVSEILVVASASAIRAPLPILPLQILFLNLVTDVFPALALGVGEGEPAVMRDSPRHANEPILRRDHWWAIVGYAALITGSVLTAFFVALVPMEMGPARAVTVSFMTLAFAQIGHVFNMRERGSRWLDNDVVRSPYVWGALSICAGLLFMAAFVPGLSDVLRLERIGAGGWGLVAACAFTPFVVGQILKSLPRSATSRR